jgi:hypothetical protein
MKLFKLAINVSITFALIMFTGCGGGGSGSSSTAKSEDNSSHQTGSENGEIRNSVSIASLQCPNADNLIAGRYIQLEGQLENTTGTEQNSIVSYYILPANMLDDNNTVLTAKGTNFGNAVITVPEGSSARSDQLILPTDLESGNYKILAMLNPDQINVDDLNFSKQADRDYYMGLYKTTSDLYIEANDGKADVETTYLALKDNTAIKENLQKAPPKETPSYTIPFDIGIIDNNVILNDRNISFTGVFGVTSFIRDAKNVSVAACIEIDEKCKPVDIFRLDENNNTIYTDNFTIENVKLNTYQDIVFNAFLNGTVLKEIVTEVLKNQLLTTKLKIMLGGIEESNSQDPAKNSIAVTVKFSPVSLSRENIDNTNDLLAPAFSDYKLTLHNYLDTIKKIEPTYNFNYDLSLFDTGGLTFTINNPTDNLTVDNPYLITDNNGFGGLSGFKKIEPVQTTPDFTLIEPIVIPTLPSNEPLKVEPKPDIASQLSLRDGISATILNSDFNDMATEEVNEKVFGKGIKMKLGGSYFGMDVELGAQAMFNREGAELSGEGDVDISLLTYGIDFLTTTAYAGIKPGQLDRTGYDMEVEFLGLNIYTEADNIAKHYHLENSAEQELGKRIKENVDKVEEYLKTHTGRMIDYTKDWNVHKEKKEVKTIMIFVVPLTFTASASGTIGIDFKMQESSLGTVSAYATPHAKLSGTGSAAIGVPGANAGIEGALNLVNVAFPSEFAAGIKFEGNDEYVYSLIGELSEKIIQLSTWINGEIDAFAEYPWPDICYKHICCLGNVPYPCIVTKHDRATIVSYEAKPKLKVLLNKHQTLFRVRVQ